MKHPKMVVSLGAVTLLSGVMLTGAMANAAAPKPAPLAAPLSSHAGVFLTVAPGATRVATVACPAGKIVTGGGGQTSAWDIAFTDSYASGNGWAVGGKNRGTTTQSIRAVAICIG